MEYIYEYLVFFAKLTTVFLSLSVPFFLFLVLRNNPSDSQEEKLIVRKINDRLERLNLELQREISDSSTYKKIIKVHRAEKKKTSKTRRSKTFLLKFDGDLKASNVVNLKDEITAVLSVATDKDQVLLLLESSGGTLHGYGLAASQLNRIKDQDVRLTVVVDRIAASGGYLMASVADEIVAAPFSIIGSIGVIGQLPNFHNFLKKNNVEFEQLTAGKHKRTLTLFGENTDEAREKFQEELDTAHQIFKDFVRTNRPAIDLERAATGEYWQAINAKTLGLVDRLATSDDIIIEKAGHTDIYEITTRAKKSLISRILSK